VVLVVVVPAVVVVLVVGVVLVLVLVVGVVLVLVVGMVVLVVLVLVGLFKLCIGCKEVIMSRIAFIRNGVAINVVEVEDVDHIPDWAVVGVDGNGNPVRKSDCEMYVITDVGSKDDVYVEDVGFYRQRDADVQSIEQVADVSSVEEIS
jgi:hypothetical protein